jgi:hypothetical protein
MKLRATRWVSIVRAASVKKALVGVAAEAYELVEVHGALIRFNLINLESAVGYQFFTAEAQKSQRNAEPCMWEDRKFGKTMELLGSPNG